KKGDAFAGALDRVARVPGSIRLDPFPLRKISSRPAGSRDRSRPWCHCLGSKGPLIIVYAFFASSCESRRGTMEESMTIGSPVSAESTEMKNVDVENLR